MITLEETLDRLYNSLPATICYYSRDGVQHTLIIRRVYAPDCVNHADVDLTGVNNLVVEVDDPETLENPRITQAGGYTDKRGLFVDLY